MADGATAAVTVSGGTLDLTKANAAALMGTSGVSFTLSGGTLDLADQTFTAGTVGDAISLASTSGLNLNSGTLALGNLTAVPITCSIAVLKMCGIPCLPTM